MTMRKMGLLIILISLLTGSLIYFITRTESIIINQWMTAAGYESVLLSLQGLIDNSLLPHWLIYSLPDALWMFAMSMTIMMIWDYQINFTSIFFTLFSTTAGAGHELLQAAGTIKGTFDIVDLIFMVIAGVLPLVIICLRKFNASERIVHKTPIDAHDPSDIIIET